MARLPLGPLSLGLGSEGLGWRCWIGVASMQECKGTCVLCCPAMIPIMRACSRASVLCLPVQLRADHSICCPLRACRYTQALARLPVG